MVGSQVDSSAVLRERLAAVLFFFFRMRAVAKLLDEQCLSMMNVALSLAVVIPVGLGIVGGGMAGYSKAGALMVASASGISFAGGLVLIPITLMGGIRRLKMTEEEKERDLFN